MSIVFRGWQGHFILPCRWHLTTLVNGRYVVSTVGELFLQNSSIKDMQTLDACDNFYETMVMKANDEGDPIEFMHQYTRHYKTEASAQPGHCDVIKEIEKL